MVKPVLIFVKPSFQKRSLDAVERAIEKNYHPDYRALLIMLTVLRRLNLKYELITWAELPEIDLSKAKICVVPQQSAIAGSCKNTDLLLSKLEKARDAGCHIILGHHHQHELTSPLLGISRLDDDGYPRAFFGVNIVDLKLNPDNSSLTLGVKNLWQASKRISDEYSYYAKPSSAFVTLIEKVPKRRPTWLHKGKMDFIQFGYRKAHAAYCFLLDVHGCGSAGRNGKLFEQIFFNTITFLTGLPYEVPLKEGELAELSKIEQSRTLTSTQKQTLVFSRLGQGRYRQDLIQMWKGCSVTKFAKIGMLRASHIKPWCFSSNKERLDPFNGFLLIPNIDSAFDIGLITFTDDGNIRFSPNLSDIEIEALGLNHEMRITLEQRHKHYLHYHRNNIFQK